MKKDFAKKIESWNRQYKAHKEAKAEEEAKASRAQAESDTPKPKKSFVRHVYDWNQHFRKGKKLESKESRENGQQVAEEKPAADEEITEEEIAEVDIVKRVSEWNQHYKSIRRQSSNRVSEDKRVERLCAINEDSTNLTEKVSKWELHYRPSLRGRREKEESRQTCVQRHSAAGDERMTELVHKWNRHYSVPRRRVRPEDTQPQSGRRSSLNRVTSLLVKQWDDHYIAATKDSQCPQLKQKSSTQSETDSSTSDHSQYPEMEKRKLCRTTLSRTPSLVRARVEEFATQSAVVSQRRQHRPKSCHQELSQNKGLCRTRSNIAELRTKFSLAQYDPKSIQRICS